MGSSAHRLEKPPRRRMTASDRRRVILNAAEQAFGDGAFQETSLEEVAEIAGVSKALIYEHFSSKRELYRALLSESAEELMRRVSLAVMARADAGREDRLLGGIGAFIDFIDEHPGSSRLLFHNSADPDVVSEVDRLHEQAANLIANLMADDVPPAREEDTLPVETAVAMLAHQLIGALQSLAVWWQRHPEIGREDVIQIAMEFTWLGLDRVSAAERWVSGGEAGAAARPPG